MSQVSLFSVILSVFFIAFASTPSVEAADNVALQGQIEQLNNAIATNQDDKRLFEERASCLIALSKFDQAIEDCNKAIKLDEQDLRAYHLRSLAYKSLGQNEAAKRDNDKLLSLATELDLANANKQIELNSERIKKNPSDSAAFSARASAHLAKNQYQDAIADATKAIAIDSKCKLAYLTRMGAYLKLNKSAEAASDRAEFDRLDREDKHQFSKTAVSEYTRLLNVNAKDENALQNRAQAYLDLGKFKEAARDLTALIKLRPTDPAIFRLRSDCYKKMNLTSLASADAKRAKDCAAVDATK
jgi:tetratricopeptide (TPR) repeat protein